MHTIKSMNTDFKNQEKRVPHLWVDIQPERDAAGNNLDNTTTLITN